MAVLSVVLLSISGTAAQEGPGHGNLRGMVLQADRPQPMLEVVLYTLEGRAVDTTRTGPGGGFQFENLNAGVYRVYAEKQESGPAGQVTAGEARVRVEAGRTKEVVIELFRQTVPPRPPG
jgi:hypothetical protein